MMVCHPTTGDVSFGGLDRVFSGVCVRSRVRPGGYVFDLHGRVPRRRARCSAALPTGPANAGTIPNADQVVTCGRPGVTEQQNTIFRVEVATDWRRVHPEELLQLKTPMNGPISDLSGERHSRVASAPLMQHPSNIRAPRTACTDDQFRQTRANNARHCHLSAAAVEEIPSACSFPIKDLRQTSRSHTGDEPSPTDEYGMNSKKVDQASDIVLVTTSGNVTGSHQLTPRG